MEHIGLIARSVCEATTRAIFFQVLTVENILAKRIQVDIVLPFNHVTRREDPPGVAHISQFVRPTIEATLDCLSLVQPHAKSACVYQIEGAEDFQGTHCSEHISCMTLGPWHRTKSSIYVLTT